jgi:MoxR-like ATPase
MNPSTAPDPRPSPQRLRTLLQALSHGLLERETAVHLALLAALGGEHLLLIGPPGTAKSALARRLHGAFAGARWFERLLTRFSTPEELFGPLSLKALEDDRYERLVEGFLPTAGVAFLDEVFKANSAILNALLTLLNEREFDNGTARLPTPLVAVIGASNEVPGDEALQAFYDRFLVRVPVAPVGDDAFAALLMLDAAATAPQVQGLTGAERQAVAAAAAQLPLATAFVDACTGLRTWLAQRQTTLSDRRWRQYVGLARTAAASEGRAEVDEWDLWLAPFVASAKPEDVPPLQAWFLSTVAQAAPQSAPWLQRAVQAFEKQLDIEQNLQDGEDGLDDSAGKLALARAIGMTEPAHPGDDFDDSDRNPAAAGMLRITSAPLQASKRHRWGRCHIDARLAQVLEIETQVAEALQTEQDRLQVLQQRLAPRLWMPVPLQATLLSGPAQTAALLQDLLQRLITTRQGFAALPCDATADSAEPSPVAWAA